MGHGSRRPHRYYRAGLVCGSGRRRLQVGGVFQLVKTPWPPFFIAAAAVLTFVVETTCPGTDAGAAQPIRRAGGSGRVAAVCRDQDRGVAIGLAVYTFGMPTEARRLGISDSQVANLPLRFDAGTERRASATYGPGRSRAGPPEDIVFFPALPMACACSATCLDEPASVPLRRRGHLARRLSRRAGAAVRART